MKILRLSLFNLKKNKREALAIVFLTAVTTLMLSVVAVNSIKTGNAFYDSFKASGSFDRIILFEEGTYHDDFYDILKDEYGIGEIMEDRYLVSASTDVIEPDGNTLSYNLLFVTEKTERRIEDFVKAEQLPEDEIANLEHPIWMPENFSIVKKYRPGDVFTVVQNGKKYPFTVAGFYNSGLASSDQLFFKCIIPDSDFALFSMLFHTSFSNTWTGLAFDGGEDFPYRAYMDRCMEVSGENLRSDYNDFNIRSEHNIEVQFLNIFLYLIAFLGMVTMASALFMIRHKISNDIEDQMQQIGVLEALGYRSGEISAAYLFEYVISGGAGALLGGILSLLMTPLMDYGIKMLLGREVSGKAQPLLVILVMIPVMLLVILFALQKAKTVKKYPPVVALRRGIRTHHFGKNLFPLTSAKGNINIRLAWKGLFHDIRSAAGIGICVILSGTALLFSVVTFMFFKDGTKGLESMQSADVDTVLVSLLPGVDPYVAREEIEAMPEVRKALVTYNYEYQMIKGSDTTGMAIVYDDFKDAENIRPYVGRCPEHDNEIMLGLRRAKNENLNVGDSIILTNDGMEKDYIITGLVGSMMNGGSILYLTSDGYRRIDPTSRSYVISAYLADGVSDEAFEEAMNARFGGTAKDLSTRSGAGGSLEDQIHATAEEKIAALMSQYGVTNVDYAIRIGDRMISGNSRNFIIREIRSWRGNIKAQMEPMANLTKRFTLLAMVLIALIVAVILMIIASSNVRRQRRSLGIMKSMGYSSKDLMQQTAMKFMPVIVVSMILASVCCVYINKFFWSALFGTIARTDLLTILVTDLLMTLFCYFVTYIGAGKIKKISVTELMTE
ncbi:MAG: ABC transporter permease [Lachnospiraceae bacterium]|nr:ABC transporter permease [Lachnospiraceae bacterium]